MKEIKRIFLGREWIDEVVSQGTFVGGLRCVVLLWSVGSM